MMTSQMPIYPGDYNSPLEVKQPFNSNISNPGCKVTYRTPKNVFNCVICPIAFFLGFGLLGLFIFLYIKLQQNEFLYFICFFGNLDNYNAFCFRFWSYIYYNYY